MLQTHRVPAGDELQPTTFDGEQFTRPEMRFLCTNCAHLTVEGETKDFIDYNDISSVLKNILYECSLSKSDVSNSCKTNDLTLSLSCHDR